jgi:Glycosyltransferase WbsX
MQINRELAEESQTTARLIAFYLPQFHPIPENDEWWGKGFTEWTNVAKAKPLFRGHYQPRIPADLGFYDLRLPEVRWAQANLARQYGIEGFCYWHYWFAGERLLERPFNEVLKSGEPDFPFCLAWANETWTGVWYGAPNRILKSQTYPGLKDYEAHFNTLLEAFGDSRYITVDGKPIFVIYRPLKLPDAHRLTDYWRNLANNAGLKGLHLIAQLESSEYVDWNAEANGFDAVTLCNQSKILQIMPENSIKRFRHRLLKDPRIQNFYITKLRRPFRLYLYEEALPHFVVSDDFTFEYYPSTIPGWDNTPRCGLNGLILHNSTPDLFRTQLERASKLVANKPMKRRIIFVKSWNEWAEGNYLEPDQKFGREYLQVIKDEIGAPSRTCSKISTYSTEDRPSLP